MIYPVHGLFYQIFLLCMHHMKEKSPHSKGSGSILLLVVVEVFNPS